MDHIQQQVEHQKELKARREAWEAQRQAEAEEKVRQEKQARMEAWLTNRRQAWVDHTSSLPPDTMVQDWKAEYVANVAAEQEFDRQLRLAEAENNGVL